MREIKYRAFHKTTRKMYSPQELQENGLFISPFGAVLFGDSEIAVNESNWELIQYTGLTDKNGVEIYECDLLSDGHFVWVVKYSDDRFIVELKSHYNKTIDNCGLKQIITARNTAKTPINVIGDIYSNPELLEQSK